VLLSRLRSNERLLIILVFSSTNIVVLEERIDTSLVYLREAQLLLDRYSEPKLRGTLGGERMIRRVRGKKGILGSGEEARKGRFR
jgi:hypothetical protein